MSSSTPAPPFALRHSPQVSELLFKLGGTLAISTYQAGKPVFISAGPANQNGERTSIAYWSKWTTDGTLLAQIHHGRPNLRRAAGDERL